MDARSITERKNALRNEIRVRLAQLSPGSIREASELIVDRLAAYLRRRADGKRLKIAVFYPLAREVDLMPLLARLPGADWYFPRCTGKREMVFHRVEDTAKDLEAGRMGLSEPGCHLPLARSDELDVILTPGTAFSPDGRRLGKGGGFYDGFFRQSPRAVRIGVALPCQLADDIPTDMHDERVHYVVTPDFSTLPAAGGQPDGELEGPQGA